MLIPPKRDLLRFGLVLAAYGNPFYSVPCLIAGGLLFQALRTPDGDPHEEAEKFFLLVPGAPIILPALALDIATEFLETVIDAATAPENEDAHEQVRRRREAQRSLHKSLEVLGIRVMRSGVRRGRLYLNARVDKNDAETFETVVALTAKRFADIPIDEFFAGITPSEPFDEAWKKRHGFAP